LFWRLAVFVVLLLVFVKLDQSAPCAEPLPSNTVEGFRQFLINDMDRLGRLVVLKRKTAKILGDIKDEDKEQKAYYEKIVDSLDARIKAERETDLDKVAVLEKQINSAAVAASILRLRAWKGKDIEDYTKEGLIQLDEGGLYRRISDKFGTTVVDVVAHGTPADQAALCVMMGEDAVQARTLKGEGTNFLTTLQKQVPQVVKLSQQARPQDQMVREAAATALAQLRAQAKDHIAAVKLLLDKDGADLGARRTAYKALSLPFTAASPRTLAAAPKAMQYSPTDKDVYVAETAALLDELAPLALPLLAQGLKDDDLVVRQTCINALRDMAAILLVPLQPAPEPGKEVIDYDFRLKPMMKVIDRIKPLIDKLAENAPALVVAAVDPVPSIRLQALAMLNDLALSRNRLRGWQVLFEQVPPPMPEKPPEAKPVARPAQAAKPDAKGDKLTPAFRIALKVLAKDLSDPELQVRLAALDVLESIGPEANSPETIPALVQALHDKNRFVRWNTLRIFNRFGPIEPRQVVPALVAVVRDQDGDGDFAKILGPTLSAYGSDAAAAVPYLIKAIQGGEVDARTAYLQALTYLGTTATDAIPAVTGMLKETDPHIRQAAAEALGRFGKAAAPAEPGLRAILDDENPDVRKAASEAILRIHGK
jgi:HEAT repeat protein